jgi:hypothetical protein
MEIPLPRGAHPPSSPQAPAPNMMQSGGGGRSVNFARSPAPTAGTKIFTNLRIRYIARKTRTEYVLRLAQIPPFRVHNKLDPVPSFSDRKRRKVSPMFDPASTVPQPPRPLGVHGSSLWESIQSEYRIDDRGGIELLAQACETTDRIARLAEQIEHDGEILQTESGPKAHPGVKLELAARQFVVRTLRELGLNLQPVREVGRPTAWKKQQRDREDADK